MMQIFADDNSHGHSPSAYAMLQNFKIGHVAGISKSAQSKANGVTPSSETRFKIDFTKPIVFQVARVSCGASNSGPAVSNSQICSQHPFSSFCLLTIPYLSSAITIGRPTGSRLQ